MKNRILLLILFLLSMILRVYWFQTGKLSGLVNDIEYRFYLWTGILFLLGFAKKRMNKTTKVLSYLSGCSFTLYLFHQTILIILGFFVLKLSCGVPLQFLLIMTGTFFISLLCYELFRRFKVTAFLFGIKLKKRNHNLFSI